MEFNNLFHFKNLSELIIIKTLSHVLDKYPYMSGEESREFSFGTTLIRILNSIMARRE